MASEEDSKKAKQTQREAEAERRLADKERQERTAECLSWREKHQGLADMFRAQEDMKALRQNKGVRKHPLTSISVHHASLPLNRKHRSHHTWKTSEAYTCVL